MEKKPDDRPQHADEVVAMLDEALDELAGQASQVPPPRPKRKTKPPRRTLATRRDLPEGTVMPHERRRRRVVLGIAGLAVILVAGGFALREMRQNTAKASPAEVEDKDPLVMRRRPLNVDNGEMIVQALVPDPLVSGQEIRSRLEIKNKLGQPVAADEIVLTIADETGAAKGMTARPRNDPKAVKGRYYFRYTFPKPGHYTLRVFPPSVDSSFEIPIDVL
jgi:hypothetical protein